MEDVFKSGIGMKYPDVWKTKDDFSSVGKAKVESLRDIVEEIQTLVRERQNLSENFIKEGEKLKREINNFLLEGAPKGEDDSEFARERAELRKKQIEISEIQLGEKVDCWKDIALLKKELRDREKELFEKESRSDEIKKILEG